MRIRTIIFLICLVIVNSAVAEAAVDATLNNVLSAEDSNDTISAEDANTLPSLDMADTSAPELCRYLNLGIGMGRDLYRDLGTSPLSYPGLALIPSLGMTWELPGWHYSIYSSTTLGVYEDALSSQFTIDAVGLNNYLELKALRCHQLKCLVFNRHPSFLWGISASNLLSVKYNTHHENASVGVSNFINLGVHSRCIYPITENTFRSTSCHLFLEVFLLPISEVCRPGYAYIDNYTSENSVMSTLGSNYHWHTRLFSGLGTEVGFAWRFHSGHRMTLSYLWFYMTSGDKGCWKYETALHSLKCTFDLELKRRPLKHLT